KQACFFSLPGTGGAGLVTSLFSLRAAAPRLGDLGVAVVVADADQQAAQIHGGDRRVVPAAVGEQADHARADLPVVGPDLIRGPGLAGAVVVADRDLIAPV